MTSLSALAGWSLGGLLLCTLLLLLRRPLRQLLALLCRSALGLAVLAAFARVGPHLGVALGVNPLNALVLGLLGPPGFGLLLLTRWLFHVT